MKQIYHSAVMKGRKPVFFISLSMDAQAGTFGDCGIRLSLRPVFALIGTS